MNAAGWVQFLARVTPELVGLARLLYLQHRGDVDAAKTTIARIGEHGAELAEGRREIDRRMKKAKEEDETRN